VASADMKINISIQIISIGQVARSSDIEVFNIGNCVSNRSIGFH
jgi:hypothetical protein